jgi:hypothetical protein
MNTLMKIYIIKVKFALEKAMKAEEEQRYSSTLSLTSALDVGAWLPPRPGRFTPGKKPGTHCTGG